MISVAQIGEELQVTISETANFETSREMLVACKPYIRHTRPKRIVVTLDQVTEFHSCTIGALLVLQDAVQGNIDIHLKHCSREVHDLYDSEALIQHFGEARSLTSKLLAVCKSCLNPLCKSKGSGCLKPAAL